MTLQKIQFKPGVYKDDSPLEAKGFWIDADKVRFVRGLPETIYGWERASTTTLLGYCRGLMTYADNARNAYAAMGTNLRLYIMDGDGNVSDLTPVTARTYNYGQQLSTTISTTVLGAAVTHGLSVGQQIKFENTNPTTLGGVTLDGTYVVATTPDAYSYTVTAAQTATSSVGATATTTYLSTYLAPGQADGIGGLGFGTGGFGSGGYASASSGLTLWPRTWSLAQWGQNLIANPRGGAIYEWAPNLGAAELTTNGTFTGSSTGWTLGSGWSYSSNTVVASNASSAVSQVVTTPPGAWCLVSVDLSGVTTGGFQISYGATTVGVSQTATTRYRTTFFTGSGGAVTFQLTGTNFSGTLDNVSLAALASGNQITNAPTQVTCVFVTTERILVACGCPNDLSADGDYLGAFDAMRVGWTDAENNQTWLTTATNLAGQDTLTNGSRIVRGLSGPYQNYIFTDTALYAMRYNPDPSVVYNFVELASNCGLIGTNAVTQSSGILFWLTPAGQFYKFDGSYPVPLNCTLRRDVMDNMAFVQQDKVFAFACSSRNEVWWLYPDERDGQECSRYVIYNFVEDHWSSGTFARTAWVDSGVYEFPLAVDTSGTVWFHEKGFSADGGARQWSVTSAFVDSGDGDTHTRLLGIVPDQEDLQGNYSYQCNARIHNSNGILLRSFPAVNITSATGNANFRANGQELQHIWSGNSSPSFWRYGATRFDIEQTGRTK